MLLTSLRICTLTEAGLAWYGRFTNAVANANTEALSAMLHPDCVYQYNNQLPFYGNRTIAAGAERYHAMYETLEHEPLNIFGDDQHFAVELLNHYVRKDGARITIPGASFMERDAAGLLVSGRLFIDTSPLFAPMTG